MTIERDEPLWDDPIEEDVRAWLVDNGDGTFYVECYADDGDHARFEFNERLDAERMVAVLLNASEMVVSEGLRE